MRRTITGHIMEKKRDQREVPSFLKKLLTADVYLTNTFVNQAEKFLPLRQFKVHYKFLEISGHGIPWFAGWIAFIWIAGSRDLYQMQVNLFIGLIFDILTVAILKAVTRRRRPSINDDPLTMGPDKYSFPSGHASRASFITFFFLNIYPVSIIFIPAFLAWTASICLSRLLLKRHHILDIVAGILIGIFEGLFIGMIYLSPETCLSLVSWVTDEKFEGGEYHV